LSSIDLAGQVQPTFHRSPKLNWGIVRPDERGLICNPSGACSRPSAHGQPRSPSSLTTAFLATSLVCVWTPRCPHVAAAQSPLPCYPTCYVFEQWPKMDEAAGGGRIPPLAASCTTAGLAMNAGGHPSPGTPWGSSSPHSSTLSPRGRRNRCPPSPLELRPTFTDAGTHVKSREFVSAPQVTCAG